ncbi:MAG: alcohol dehydrogenase catalytic domain-containing protein [Actinobacteria bacterium]|nr:alcohol dehydrogenase catalytic domain-containing protein [Actinomycetota bacterium]
MSRPTVRALRFSLAPHRVALAVTAGRFRSDVRHGGPGSPLRLTDIPRPERPTGWVRIAPDLAGICASDRKYLSVDGLGMTLTALYGFPRGGVVLGHEVVGRVVEADRDSGLSEGDRVVAEPTLGCTPKGFAACDRCTAGDDHLCAHFADKGVLAQGPGFGFDARFGGGWAEELVAPAERVHRVPDGLDDRSAVLTEPTAIAVHAVLRHLPRAGHRVLVVGPGAIGLSLVHALSALVPDAQVTVAGIGHAADDLALRAGATELLHGTRRELVEAAGQLLASDVRGNAVSGPVLEAGFDVVFDAVATPQTIDDAFRMTRPGGTVVLVGTAAKQKVDWSLVWHRELHVGGTVFYGVEDVPATARVPVGRRRAFEVALDVLSDVRPGHLVTHVFPLEESVEAIDTAAAGPGRGAVRVAFAPAG